MEGYKAKEIGAGIVREYGLAIDDAELDGIVRQRRELYQSFKPDGMRPDARRAVVQLKSLGVSAAIVSGAAYQMIAAVLAGGELQLFDAIVSADAYRLAKPHPEPFLTGCAKLGFSPTECAVVENAPLGIASARAAGITVFGVSTTLPAQELAGADRVIPNLDSLIPAMDDYFIFQ